MKKFFTVFLNVLLLVVFFSTTSLSALKPIVPDKVAKMKVIESFGKLPLSFTENRGQLNSKVSYYLKGRKGTIYFTREGIVYDLITAGNPSKDKTKSPSLSHKKSRTFQRLSFTMKPIGANRDVRLTANNKLPGQVNYLIGNNPKKWHKEIPLYKEIVYKDLYKDIDLKIYGNKNRMEYDFIVSPGADPKVITIACEGIDALSVDTKGDLLIKTPLGEITHLRPLIYQEIEGTRHFIDGAFKVAENTFSFGIGDYNKEHALIIDPLTLSYSTYLGGSGLDAGSAIAVDSSGAAYVTGETGSTNFPTVNAYQGTYGGGEENDAFITKLSPNGNTLSYSTYIGGSGWDYGSGIAVDSSGAAYVTGDTGSTNFPTVNAYQGTLGGGEYDRDAFVTKLSPAGNTLSYSTYLGGSGRDCGSGIAVDSSGAAYVTGDTGSTNFPTVNAYQGTLGGNGDAFVTKLSPAGNTLSYSTYLGGNDYYDPYGNEYGSGIAVDSSGAAYVTGGTGSTDFPTNNAYQATFGGAGEADADAFVTKLSPAGNTLLYSTYLGGSDWDHGRGIAVDSSESAYITGTTTSTDFPTNNAYQGTHGGEADAFVTKFGTAQKRYWYVDGTVANPGDGTSPDKAFRAIQAAIDAAGKDDEIWLKKGIYELSSPVNVDKAVAIYGGFTGGETQRDQRDYSNNVTTIDGQGSVYHCFYITANATIDGLTITGGNANGSWPDSSGGGIFNDENSSSTITNCSFTGNSADDVGGGIYNEENSSPTITNCTFSGNSADDDGGGIYNKEHSSPTITNCDFRGNSASWGGGISNCNSSPAITNCSFTGNSATEMGGAILNFDNSSPTITSCAFTGNSATEMGGAILNIDNSSPTITNCAFSGNSATEMGGAILNFDNSSPTITNCILWGNTATTDGPEIYNYDISSSPLVTYCDIQGGYGGEGNINSDPLFVDPSNNDFHLQATSPCIDKGNNSAPEIPNTDFEGDTRIVDGDNDGTATVDMGMDEYTFIDTDSDGLSDNWEITYFGDLSQGPDGDYDGDGATNLEEYQAGTNPANNPPTADAGPDQSITEGDTVTLDASSSTDPDDGIASYLWEQTDGPQVTLSSTTDLKPNFTAPSGIQNSVTITFQLTVTDNGGLHNTDTVVITVRLSPVMPSTPDGDIAPLGNPDGTVNVGDALVCLRFALGLETPTQEDTAHGDVAPLDINGQPDPDGQITVGDALVILRKALGLVDWTISKDTHTINSTGGSVDLSNGATLDIPPNSAATPVEVLFTETPTPPHIGGEVIKAYAFVTDSELLASEFTLPVEATDVTSIEDLMIVHMQGQHGPADPVDFTYDLSAHTVSFSLSDNWTFQNIPGPAKNRYMNGNRNSNTPQENNKDNTLLVIKRSPYPTVTGKSGPIQMPFFEQFQAGTCWANSGKMLQKGLYPGYLGATLTYEVFQFMRMLNLGLNEGIYWGNPWYDLPYTFGTIPNFADVLGRGKTIQYERYFYWNSWSSVQKKIAEEINRGNPVLFFRNDHMVLVLGYEMDIAGDLYLTQHNPQNINGLYQSEKWEDAIKNQPSKDVVCLLWAADTPDPNRALQSINLPGQEVDDKLKFHGKKTNNDPSIMLHLKFDETSTDGYRWQKYGSTTIENTNHFPKNVNLLSFKMPVYNADLYNSANVTCGIKVYEKDKPSNAVIFTQDLDIPRRNRVYFQYANLDLTSVRVNLDAERECVLYITLEKGNERTTSIPIDNFFLQPIELEITVSIPGAPTGDSGSYKIVADGTSTDIIASVKDVDGNNVADGTKVEFATTGGTLSGTSATTTNGEATVTLTSPTTIGSADITATVKEMDETAVDKEISGSTKVDFIAGPVATLTLSASPNTLPADGTSTSTIEVKAVDLNGNPVADSTIGLTASSGSLSASSTKTDKNGAATVTLTSPTTIGSADIIATVGKISSSTRVDFITAGPVATLTLSANPETLPADGTSTSTIEVKAVDLNGNPVADSTIGLTASSGSLSANSAKTNSSGIASVIYTAPGSAPSGGTSTITATINNITATTVITISSAQQSWPGWPDPQWCPRTGSFHTITDPNGNPDTVYCGYHGNGQIEYETPYVNGTWDGIQKRYYESGQLYTERPYVDGKVNGLCKEYYESGQLSSESTYVDDKRNGIFKEYYESGQLSSESIYVDGKINGICKDYYESGQLSGESTYVDGKRDGIQKWYYENGQLGGESTYVDGKRDGIFKDYYENGQLKHKTPWKNNTRDGIEKDYYENGQLRKESTFVDGVKNGIEKEYRQNGEIWVERPWQDDHINGIEKEYYANGYLSSETPYIDGIINGIEKKYYESGPVKYETPYADDEKNGTEKEYYESGELHSEASYVDDKKNGQMKWYDKDGKLADCEIYENDNYVGSCMP